MPKRNIWIQTMKDATAREHIHLKPHFLLNKIVHHWNVLWSQISFPNCLALPAFPFPFVSMMSAKCQDVRSSDPLTFSKKKNLEHLTFAGNANFQQPPNQSDATRPDQLGSRDRNVTYSVFGFLLKYPIGIQSNFQNSSRTLNLRFCLRRFCASLVFHFSFRNKRRFHKSAFATHSHFMCKPDFIAPNMQAADIVTKIKLTLWHINKCVLRRAQESQEDCKIFFFLFKWVYIVQNLFVNCYSYICVC